MTLPVFCFHSIDNYRVLAFQIPDDGITTIPEFRQVLVEYRQELELSTQPLMIHGKGPIWAYGMILAITRTATALGVYDPRLGFVIVESSSPDFTVGQVIENHSLK